HEFELRSGERHKTPILLPSLVVNFAESPAFIANVPKIPGADGDRPAPAQTLRHWSQTCGGLRRIGKPPCVPIFRFYKTAALDQLPVIGRIVRGQDRGRKLESVD